MQIMWLAQRLEALASIANLCTVSKLLPLHKAEPAPAYRSAEDWDPFRLPPISYYGDYTKRILREYKVFHYSQLPGILIVPHDEYISWVDALIVGPCDTPYEGGFFHFHIRYPQNYPFVPFKIRLLTTGNGTNHSLNFAHLQDFFMLLNLEERTTCNYCIGSVQFNPNFLRNGKVCVDILDTCSELSSNWSSTLNLYTILPSIQSLMNERPYQNAIGFEKERCFRDAERYNEIIAHECIRVAVCEQLETRPSYMPPALFKAMREKFSYFFKHYVSLCYKHSRLNGLFTSIS